MDNCIQANNKWFAISMGLVGVIVGYALATGTGGGTADVQPSPSPTAQQPTAQPPTPEAGDVDPVDKTNDHILGDVNAQISVIEYSDFECPFCTRHKPTIEQIVEEYDGDVNVVYRHFPLSFHQNAQKAAEATECAAAQDSNDGFWGMHDMIFDNGIDPEKYAGYAEELDFNVSEFTDCLESGEMEQKVTDDITSGQNAGVRGTPGNIIFNNKTKEAKLVSGAQPLANFKTVIDAMLK